MVFCKERIDIVMMQGAFQPTAESIPYQLGTVDLLGFDHIIEFGFTRIVDGAATAKFVLPIKEYYIFKLLATVVVTILNFIASKFIIFRKGQKQAMLDKADPSNEDEQAEETEE